MTASKHGATVAPPSDSQAVEFTLIVQGIKFQNGIEVIEMPAHHAA
jgi:hypothetical protein